MNDSAGQMAAQLLHLDPGLAILIAVAAPFAQPAALSSKVFTAIINLVAGVAVISLLSGTARSAVRPGRPAPSVTHGVPW